MCYSIARFGFLKMLCCSFAVSAREQKMPLREIDAARDCTAALHLAAT